MCLARGYRAGDYQADLGERAFKRAWFWQAGLALRVSVCSIVVLV